jgi:hypothetical protein
MNPETRAKNRVKTRAKKIYREKERTRGQHTQ